MNNAQLTVPARYLAGQEEASQEDSEASQEGSKASQEGSETHSVFENSSEEEGSLGSQDSPDSVESMSTKPATKNKSPKITKSPAIKKGTTPKKKVSIPEDDLVDITDNLGDLAIDSGPNFSLEVRDQWKKCGFIRTLNGVQFYEARVDIFLQAPIFTHQVRCNLSKCGTKLEYQRFSSAWFGSHKHFEREYLTDNPGVLFDANNAENMALFQVAQEIKTAHPEMDSGHKLLPSPPQLIPLPFKCKGEPYDVTLRHYPTPIIVPYMGRNHHTFQFVLSVKVKGAKEIVEKKAEARSHGCEINGIGDLYD